MSERRGQTRIKHELSFVAAAIEDGFSHRQNVLYVWRGFS